MLPTVIINQTDKSIDLCETYGLIWTNDGELKPPKPNLNTKDVPGMDGFLDLTETLTGDVTFGERSQEFVFYVKPGPDFEKTKTLMQNLLHGRSYDYQLSVDPGYTYHGRWECDSYFSRMHYREIKFTVHADPWKRGEHVRLTVQCAGGTDVALTNGRRHVHPVITVEGPTEVSYQSRAMGWTYPHVWNLPEAGSWEIENLRLDEGDSILHINTAPTMCDTTMDDLQNMYGTMAILTGNPNGTGGARMSEYFYTGKSLTTAKSLTTMAKVAQQYVYWNNVPAHFTIADLAEITVEKVVAPKYQATVEYDVEDL